jgi:hypothetical protein
MWRPRQLPANFSAVVNGIYEPAAESAKPGFDEEDLRCLRSVITLTVDFHTYLNGVNVRAPDKNDITYACGSIFSGIESFVVVNNSYKILEGSLESNPRWDLTSLESLKERFITIYQEFLSERIFIKQCRLLLDLFKLQLVFTGMLFE